MINTGNISERMTNLNSGTNQGDGLAMAASFLGRKRPSASFNNGLNYWTDDDYELWALGSVAWMQGGTGTYQNYFRVAIPGSGQNVNYHFYSPVAASYRIFPYFNNTGYYKNGTLQGSINVGSYANISLAAGDRFSANSPIAIYPGAGQEHYEPAYSGWSGYKFMTRFDRYDPSTVYIFATLDTVASINVYVDGTSNAPLSNWGAPAYSTTNLGLHQMWSFSNVSANVLIEASDPICCVVYASSNRDVRKLYPLTHYDKYGVFSSSGHILSCANFDNGSVNATLVGYGTNSTNSTNFTAAFNPGALGGNGTYVDDAAAPTGGASYTGPAVLLRDTTGKSLFAGESQGDGDGSDMVQFPDANFMYLQKYAYMPDAADWVGVVAYGGSTNSFVHEWGNAGWKIRSWRFSQASSWVDVQYAYCQRMFNSTTTPPLFESDLDSNAFFWDKNGDHEDIQFPSSTTDFSFQTANAWPSIYWVQNSFGTPFNPTADDILSLCAGAAPQSSAYGDGADPNSSTYMYANPTQDNWILNNAPNSTVFFTDMPIPGGNIWKIENYDANDNELLYEHTLVGVCEGEGGGKSDIRLKENITQIDVSPSGIPIYTFNYIGNSDLYEGVMAQDLLELGFNDAVGMGDDGYYFVRYDLIDVDMKKL